MSFSTNQANEAKAREHVKAGEKALETSVFKLRLRPDYFMAATEFTEAAQCYQVIKNSEEARKCFMRAAEYRLKENDHLSAARCFEQAGAYDKASDCYVINGGIEQAVRSLMRKAAASSDMEIQYQCFDKALELYAQDQTDFKGILASDIYKQYIPKLVSQANWSRYFEVSRMYRDNLIQLEQYPFVHKELLGNVVVNLAAKKDIVGAERVLSNSDNLSIEGFVHSQEFAIADDLINAVKDNDEDLLKRTLAKPVLSYLNVELVKLAKSIKTVVSVPAEKHDNVDTLLM